jgi:hypothetical protein
MRMGSDPSDAMEKLAKLHPPRSAAVVQPRQVPVERVILNQLPRVVQHPQAMLPPANPPSINPPRVILPGFATVGQPQHIPQEQPMQAQPPMMMMAPPASQTWTSPAPSVAQPALPNPNAPMYPAQQPDALSVIMQTLMGMQQQIDSLRPQQVQPFVQEARQPDYTPLETEAIADLSALEIPWLTPVVMPPTVDVMFNLGDAGGVRTKYHHVEITDALILLIYDSRFEMATQYTPPFTRTREAGPLILQIGKSKSQHQAHHYPGLDFALGVYHVTLLMKVVLEPEDPVDPANVI